MKKENLTYFDLEALVQDCIDADILIEDKKGRIVVTLRDIPELEGDVGLMTLEDWEFIQTLEEEPEGIDLLISQLKEKGIDWIQPSAQEELELTDEMVQRNDDIDNAVYQTLLVLSEKSENELPWDMCLINEGLEALKSVLDAQKIKVRHPGVVTDRFGRQRYEE